MKTILAMVLSGVFALSSALAGNAIDYADSAQRDAWLRHPVLGDASFDAFEHDAGNPVCRGAAPYEWPVNGFYFADPKSTNWYIYVGEYCEGYAFKENAPSICVVYRSRDHKTWERVGTALSQEKHVFAGETAPLGHAPDVSVLFADGKYHMVYDWCTTTTTWENAANPPADANSGVGYAWADKPEGPFHPTARPVATTRDQEPILGKYRRLYASTLLHRKRDWVVLTLTDSGPYFGWALLGERADHPEGPYTKPALLLHPELDRFHPPLLEFFPAFVHEGYVYAPATSVAMNRNYQAVFRAPMEDALKPEAWELWQHGDVWHAEPVENETYGIWGQAFAGAIGGDGIFRVMFPSRDEKGLGTINMAQRRWDTPYRKSGFVVSGHRGPSVVVLKRGRPIEKLDASLRVRGTVTLAWDYQGPLGPDRPKSEASPHSLSFTRYNGLELTPKLWAVVSVNDAGERIQVASGATDASLTVNIALTWNASDSCSLSLDGKQVWKGAVPNGDGPMAVFADKNSHAQVDRFLVQGVAKVARVTYLYTEALLDAAQNLADWDEQKSPNFRYGIGAVSKKTNAHVKWNVEGSELKVWAPKSSQFGQANVYVDGNQSGVIDFHAGSDQSSQAVYSHTFATAGLHAVRLESVEGAIPIDSVEVTL